MPSRGITRETKLEVTLSAICSRHQFTTDPVTAIEELRAAAGERTDVLAREVGIWIGYFESAHSRTFTTALRELPGVEPWIDEGRRRRSLRGHSTADFRHRE